MLSVKHTLKLRAEQTEKLARQKQLNQDYQVAKRNRDRNTQVKITKELRDIEERLEFIVGLLKNAPADPWAPEVVWPQIQKSFNYTKVYEEAQAKFQETFAINPGYAFEWQTVNLVQLQHKCELTAWVHLDKGLTDEEKIKLFYLQLPHFMELLREEILQGSLKQTSMSTSAMANVVSRARLEAAAEILDSLTHWGFDLKQLKAHYESWVQLQEENHDEI